MDTNLWSMFNIFWSYIRFFNKLMGSKWFSLIRFLLEEPDPKKASVELSVLNTFDLKKITCTYSFWMFFFMGPDPDFLPIRIRSQ